MEAIAVPDATWGIIGPAFLGWYAALAALSIGVVLLVRHRAVRPESTRTPATLAPIDTAYLTGGPSRAIAAALTSLWASDAVRLDERDKLVASGTVPATGTALEHALHRALAAGKPRSVLYRDRRVVAELDTIERRLLDTGLLLPDASRRRFRRGYLYLLPVLSLGLVRAIDGGSNGRPTGYLMALLVVTGIVTLVLALRKPPRESVPAKRLVERMRSQQRHLRPERSPATTAYGATAAATAVALFGASVLWQDNPTFAAAAGLSMTSAAAASGGSSWASTGYTGTGGASCGGGSSGGGCGGGGGGGGCGG